MKKIKAISIMTLLFWSLNCNAIEINNSPISVCFTPGENCTSEIVNAINTATNTVLVQAYSFTSAPIANALVGAKMRGVDVRVIFDKSQRSQKYSSSRFLLSQGIPTWIDYKPAIAHNKIIIIDNKEVITGSFNFTSAAQKRNAENLLIIQNADLAKKYADNWKRRERVSEKIN